MNSDWYLPVFPANNRDDMLIVDRDNLADSYVQTIGVCGRPINNWPGGIWFRPSNLEMDGQPDDVLANRYALPIFSPKLIHALAEQRVRDFQYLPVDVFRFDGTLIEGYAIANIPRLTSALDLEKASYDRFPDDYQFVEDRGRICSVKRDALRRAPLQGLDALQLAEWTPALYVSSRFRDVFLKNRFTGMIFYRVEVT